MLHMPDLSARYRPEAGMTLVEVIVAMFIFVLISTGVAASMVAATAISADSRSRVAANQLASAQIDFVRSEEDVFDVVSETLYEEVDGTAYTVVRSTSWVSSAGTDVTCSSANASIQYKRINVTVSWTGALATRSVHADTLLTPGSRINDPNTGTILISAVKESGAGNAGVTVEVTPVSGGGGAAVTAPIPKTDADGCSYVLRVAPGSYTVKLSKPGSVDLKHAATPTVKRQVAKGGSVSAAFTFDTASKYRVKYVPTPLLAPITEQIKRPSNMDVTFFGSGDPTFITDPSTSSDTGLFPWSLGYQAVAGSYSPTSDLEPCTAVDPAAWPEDTTKDPAWIGSREPLAYGTPTVSTDLVVPVGAVNIKGSGVDSGVLYAVRNAGSLVGPDCGSRTVYSFGAVVPKAAKDSVTVMLPYGSWSLYTQSSRGAKVDIPQSQMTHRTGGTFVGGVVVLDPRRPPS